jgi:hypothetical protein
MLLTSTFAGLRMANSTPVTTALIAISKTARTKPPSSGRATIPHATRL